MSRYAPKSNDRPSLRVEGGASVATAPSLACYGCTPAAADTDAIAGAQTLLDGAAQSLVFASLARPISPGVLTLVGNQAGITGNVLITGTDASDQAATETLAINGTTAVTGTQVFKTITQIDLPVRHASGDQVKITAGSSSIVTILGFTTLTTVVQHVKAWGQPDVPRNLSITGNASGITGDVVITGKNFAGEAISETLALNGTSIVLGAKAFKTISTIALPARTHASDTVIVGTGSKIGLPSKLAANTVLFVLFNKTADSSPTTTVSATALESNGITPAGTLDGAKTLEIYYIA